MNKELEVSFKFIEKVMNGNIYDFDKVDIDWHMGYIRQSIQSNITTNKELKIAFENDYEIKIVDGTWYYIKDNKIKGIVSKKSILQSLTPPTADEIVKELNELFSNGEWYYDELVYCFTSPLYSNYFSDKYIDARGLPLKLAHDITSFFMAEEK